MSASAEPKSTQKVVHRVVVTVLLQFLRPDDRRIMIFDPGGEWQHVEARRGQGPHGASRRRARSSAGRVRGRREVATLVDRDRRADKKKQANQARGAKQNVLKRDSPPG